MHFFPALPMISRLRNHSRHVGATVPFPDMSNPFVSSLADVSTSLDMTTKPYISRLANDITVYGSIFPARPMLFMTKSLFISSLADAIHDYESIYFQV